jgi:hypothetical protein
MADRLQVIFDGDEYFFENAFLGGIMKSDGDKIQCMALYSGAVEVQAMSMASLQVFRGIMKTLQQEFRMNEDDCFTFFKEVVREAMRLESEGMDEKVTIERYLRGKNDK